MSKKYTQEDILKEYYIQNPNRDISHPEVVDWVTSEYKKRTGNIFRDPDRGIRKLAQNGFLIKISKGVYRYDPNYITNKNLEDFTPQQKKQILERDGYKCVICGKGQQNGVELHVDHIKPKEYGGKATVENGQVLCAQHNFQKKTLKQTETGKKMFMRMYELAKKENHLQLINFTKEILKTFDKHDINGHIEWEE